jgi:hypothetical protein
MKSVSYDQFAIVSADSASLFNQQLNAEIYRLKDKFPTVQFSESTSPFYAQIKYKETDKTPETIADEYELAGVCFVCAQCPYFEPDRTIDGEIDKRSKKGNCNHPDSEFGRAIRDAAACELLYEQIKKGGVRLCFVE